MAALAGTINERAAQVLQVDLVTDLGDIERLGVDWEHLNHRQSDHSAPFFQSHAWCVHVARQRLKLESDSFRPLIAVVRRSGEAIGIWPLALQHSKGAWIAKCLDDPFGQFAGVVFEAPEEIGPGVAAILAALRARHDIDGLAISGVVAGSPLELALRQSGIHGAFTNQAPWIDLAPFATFRDFQASVNSKTRKNLRNALNRLQRAGNVEYIVTDEPNRLSELVAQTFNGRLDWLNQRGKSSTAFRERTFQPLVTSLSGNDCIGLLGFSLVVAGQTIASQWGFTYDGSYYAYISARDEQFEQFSAGRLLLGMVIESCYARGIRHVELMPPAVDYKLNWTKHIRQLEDFAQPFTLKGRLVLNMLDGAVIPAARSLVRCLPVGTRQRLSALLNKSASRR